MTPNEAAELMRRSQVGGVPTSEFDAGGGYDAVAQLAQANTTGYQQGIRTVADMTKYAPNDAVTRFDAGGQGGQGETFYASGNSATGGAPGVNEKLNTLSSQYGLLNTQYGTLNTSFLDLQKQLAALKTKSAAGTSAASLTTSGGAVDMGTSNTASLGGTTAGSSNGIFTGASSTGAVYGPDGTAYSGPAAAIAAGVYNYSMFPPTGAGQPKGLVNNSMNTTAANKLSGVTGNYYGGTNQNPDNPWVNLYPMQ
jgi:hypothetical protein